MYQWALRRDSLLQMTSVGEHWQGKQQGKGQRYVVAIVPLTAPSLHQENYTKVFGFFWLYKVRKAWLVTYFSLFGLYNDFIKSKSFCIVFLMCSSSPHPLAFPAVPLPDLQCPHLLNPLSWRRSFSHTPGNPHTTLLLFRSVSPIANSDVLL